MMHSVRTLLSDLIDYAGLFPPAKLEMAPAVESYARCRAGEHEWMLGHFICPVSRLREFSAAAAPLLPGTFATSGYREQVTQGEGWRLSVLMDGPLEECLDTIDRFNAHHEQEANGLATIDTVEIKVTEVNQIDDTLDELPEDLFPFFEFPLTTDCRGYVAALAGNNSAAKIRTGGVMSNAFPMTSELAAFLHACSDADVPFKATAGLHHPVRGAYKLTYEKDASSCTMHGFLNLFVAAAMVRAARIDLASTIRILETEDAKQFKFAQDVLACGVHLIDSTNLARVRETFALSFGSCSFQEPIDELRTIGALES